MKNEEYAEIPTPNEIVRLCICDEHWQVLVSSLLQNGVHVTLDRDDVDERIRLGKMDPLIHLANTLSANAIHNFGLDNVLMCNGCPVCTFHKIVDMTAAQVAKHYLSTQ